MHSGFRRAIVAALLCSSTCIPVSAPALTAGTDQVQKTESEPRYDRAAEIDITGSVLSVREVARGSPLSGLHLDLVVSTENGKIDSYLGPADFIKEFDVTFSKGDTVNIVGSRVTFRGVRVVLARQVRKGDICLYLRDDNGYPNWPTPMM
jgi:DNA/RNA endonuclease YhcR with UshA esterase domain